MFKFYIWDKVSNINDASAEYMLQAYPKRITDDVIVITNEYDMPMQVECRSDLESHFGLKFDTIEEVAQAYIDIRIKEHDDQQKEQETLEKQAHKIALLEGSQDKQDDKILQTMLATTEIFEMVLMMSTPQTKGADINNYNIGGNSMVEVYVTLILEGVKTIDQVPSILRVKVQEQLDLLTK